MISDVLFDACEAIKHYLHEMPTVYADCLGDVLEVYRAMDRLRQKLDCPYSDTELVELGFVPQPQPEEPLP